MEARSRKRTRARPLLRKPLSPVVGGEGILKDRIQKCSVSPSMSTGTARSKAIMGIRILVIEDEEPIADFLTRGLREEGFTVEHAAEGESAWHELQNGPWDLVLLDWWLP